MANQLDCFLNTPDNLIYIDKKSELIFAAIDECSVICSKTITLDGKSFFLDSDILKKVMNIVENIDRIVKSAEAEDIHLHEAYIVFVFMDIRKRLYLLSDKIGDIFKNLSSYQDQIKDQRNIVNDYWNEKLENIKDKGLEELRNFMDPARIDDIFKNFHQYRFSEEEKYFYQQRHLYNMDCV